MIPKAYALGQVVPPLRGWSEAILLALAEPEVDSLFLTNGAAELRLAGQPGVAIPTCLIPTPDDQILPVKVQRSFASSG
jgi:hypothetical protein